VQLFEYLLDKNNLHEMVKKAISEIEFKGMAVEFIKELIQGKGTIRKNKKFLYQVCLYAIHSVFIKFVLFLNVMNLFLS
jgi:hypothetical protein